MSNKIDIFIHCLKGGGAERVCVTIANKLVELGIEVRLVTLYSSGAKYEKDIDDKVKRINLCNNKNIIKNIVEIYKFVKNNNIEKVLTFNNNISIILLFLRKITNSKFKIFARNINTLSLEQKYEKSFIKKNIIHKLIKLFYKNVDLCICQSKGMAKDLIENYGFNKRKVKVINNPVSDRFLNKNIVKGYDKKKEILFVGRLEKQKGLKLLLEAYKKVLNRNPEVILRIIGEGSLREELVEFSKRIGIESNVKFQEFTDDIIKNYVYSDITVLSSYFEGFPNVLVESITVGTPVVSFDCPSGPNEIILDGINGYLVEYLNVDMLVEKLNLALSQEWNIEEIKKSATRFTSNIIVKQYIECLGLEISTSI